MNVTETLKIDNQYFNANIKGLHLAAGCPKTNLTLDLKINTYYHPKS